MYSVSPAVHLVCPALASSRVRSPVLKFSSPVSSPAGKGVSLGKVGPIVHRIGNVAGRVADVAGKVAVVASVL